MTWALRRQIFYVVVFVLALGIFGFLVISPSLKQAPSCTDGVQDGNETGVDCGGSCANACVSQVDPVSVLWVRSFEVVPGRYNAVAFLENHNKNAAVDKISYRFRFADANNLYIGKREGSTFIPPSGKFAVFEPAVDLGNSVPVYTTFEFIQAPNWVQVPQQKIDQLKVSVSSISLQNTDTSPALSATVRNNSLYTIPEVGIVAILYDASGNVVSVSRTYLDSLAGEASKDINFTWPEPFTQKVVAEDIIPLYNILSVKLQ